MMVLFIKGYDDKGRRINEWKVDDSTVKTTFHDGAVQVIEGAASKEQVKVMQGMVDESVRRAEGNK